MSEQASIEEEDDANIDSSYIWFAEEILGLNLYWWQADLVTLFDVMMLDLVMASLATPNESGKSSVVIPTLVLGTLALYDDAKVILTSADGKQVDEQVMPAINRHRSKFHDWDFIQRAVRTPGERGSRFVAFSTDDPGKAEGFQPNPDGPLLIICDEAKSIPDKIFEAIDRCGYNGLLLTSSPGKMRGQFYDSQFKPELGYHAIRIGLKDCPHIKKDKIDRIIKKYGANSPFTRSSLHGEFIEIYEGDPVYYAYSMDAHERAHLGWPSGAIIVIGMDAGTRNASVIMAVKEDKNRHTHIWVLREIVLPGSDTDRQAVKLLEVLAQEFPFWNQHSLACPDFKFYCDPAFNNSSYTKARTTTSSPMSVLHSHKIYPGYKYGLHLQPSIAVVNRMLQNNHTLKVIDFKTGDTAHKAVWHFQIDKTRCPELCDGFRGRYRYPVAGEPGYGKDEPLKGDACMNVDHPHDAMRYAINGIMALADEKYEGGMKTTYEEPSNPEQSRTI